MSKDLNIRKYDLEIVGTEKELGTMQYNVLVAVTDSQYENAIKILFEYRKSQKGYPSYEKRTGRLFDHCAELVDAIKAKKTFPNLTSLAQSKQEEIHQKARENWEDLKVSLRRIKTIESDLKVADSRSSIWVIRAAIFSTGMVLTVFVLKEATRSFGHSLPMLVEEIVKALSTLLE